MSAQSYTAICICSSTGTKRRGFKVIRRSHIAISSRTSLFCRGLKANGYGSAIVRGFRICILSTCLRAQAHGNGVIAAGIGAVAHCHGLGAGSRVIVADGQRIQTGSRAPDAHGQRMVSFCRGAHAKGHGSRARGTIVVVVGQAVFRNRRYRIAIIIFIGRLDAQEVAARLFQLVFCCRTAGHIIARRPGAVGKARHKVPRCTRPGGFQLEGGPIVIEADRLHIIIGKGLIADLDSSHLGKTFGPV